MILFALPAWAMRFEDGGAKIDMVPTSGNSIDIDPGASTIQDIKGYPITSPFYDPSTQTTIYLGLGVLVSGEVGPVTLVEGPVILTIQRLQDSANGNIKVKWQINPAYIPPYNAESAVDIYFSTGNGSGEYGANTFYKIISNNSLVASPPLADVSVDRPDKSFSVAHQVGVGYPELYFKGEIYSATNPGSAKAADLSGLAVGKVNVNFGPGYTLFENPLWAQDVSLPAVLGDQLPNKDPGDELYSYNMDKSTYSSGKWVGYELRFEKNRGYYLRLLSLPAGQSVKTITFVGKVDPAESSISLAKGYSMIGNPYPKAQTIDAVFPGVYPGDTTSSGDEIYDKYANKKTFTAAGWVGADFRFQLGDGFWFKRIPSAAYEWKLSH